MPQIISNRFTLNETIYGHEVIDSDGRPVTDPLEHNAARRAAEDLNVAAGHGPQSLAFALGCIDDDLVTEEAF